MFRKFDKIHRLKVPQYQLPPNKSVLSDAERKQLMGGNFHIEEKLDGGNVGIVRCKQDPGFKLQKRGSLVEWNEHKQYQFFVNWANSNIDKILKIPMKTWVYFELMYAKHNIYYDQLPSYLICTDVFSGDMYWGRKEKEDLCAKCGFTPAPLIDPGFNTRREDLVKLITKSAYSSSETMEGLVIKNYKRGIRAKIVRPEFMKQIEESDHWMNQPVVKNGLREGVEALA